jgi:hypothetical protein
MSGRTSTEIWTVEKLVAALGNSGPKPIGPDKTVVRIPRFQRPLVWSQEKRESLIKSVLQGFPIGTLLLWQDPEDPVSFLLVDGQQRSATLKEHAYADLALLTRSALEESVTISQALRKLYITAQTVRTNISFTDFDLFDGLASWLKHQKKTSNNSFHIVSLLNELSSAGQRFDDKSPGVADSAHELINAIKAAVDVTRMSLPVLIYSGPGTDLDDIFVKINEQGVALTKYQVWAALWAEDRVPYPSQEILDEQDKRSQALQDQGLIYEVEGPASEINLFEYLNAIGHLLSGRYSELFPSVKHPSEQAFSFSVAALYFDLDLSRKSAGTLPSVIRTAGADAIGNFYLNFDAACRSINKALKEIAALRLSDRQSALPHPELQMVALVAWMAREARSGRLPGNAELTDAIKSRYVLDLLAQPFRGPGDKLAYERVQAVSKDGVPLFYRIKPERAELARAIDTWISDDRKNTKKRRPISQESLKRFLLRLIASTQVTVEEQAKFLFDVDHIQALSSNLFKVDGSSNDGMLAPHELGNLCLLEHQLNLKKGKQDLSSFLETLSPRDKAFVIKVGHLDPDLVAGVLLDAETDVAYTKRAKVRSELLAGEILKALNY